MQSGDHVCGIYRTDEDQRSLMVAFIRLGIERNERILYIVNVHTAAGLRSILEEAGIDVGTLLSRGQLVVLTAKDAYLRGGEFDPKMMLQILRGETDKAVADGYAGLRVTGEMTWALAGEPGSERLIEYESLINDFFQSGRRCTALCQYDRRRFDSEILLDVLHTHPKVMYGVEGFDNSHMYYVPPAMFLGGDRQSAVLDRWLTNLAHEARLE